MPSKAPLAFPSETKPLTDFGGRFRLARLRRRLTAVVVAERANISRQTLAKAERGDPSVTLGTYLRILAIYWLENDLAIASGDDILGRRLQDLALPAPRKMRRVREIINLYGGNIEVESTFSVGTTVALQVPTAIDGTKVNSEKINDWTRRDRIRHFDLGIR